MTDTPIHELFDYVEDYPGQDQTLIKIKAGEFKDVIFKFGTVRLVEHNGVELKVNFDYHLIQSPGLIPNNRKPDLEKQITTILNYLIQNRYSI